MSTPPPADESSDKLFRRVLRETLHFGALQTVGQVVLWATNVVVARQLSPRDYGVYDICTFFLTVGYMIGDVGLGAALVRKPAEPSREEYESVFALNVLLGSALSTALVASAPLLARAYHLEGRLWWVLVAIAPSYVTAAFRTYPIIRMERSLEFGKLARIELAVMLVRQGVATACALLGLGVWALVGAYLASTFLFVVLLYAVRPGLLRPRFHAAALKPLVAFGVNVQFLALAGFFKDNVANALFGVLFGPATVGLFNFGTRYIEVPVVAVNSVRRIQMPTYARLLGDPAALHKAVRGVLRVAYVAGVPALVVMAAVGPWVVPTLYKPHWLPSLPVTWSLLPNMVCNLGAGPLFTLLQARGRASLALGLFVAWTLGTWGLCLAAYALGYGLVGVGAAHSLATALVFAFLLFDAGSFLGRSLVPSMLGPVVSGALAAAAHWAALRWGGAAARHPALLFAVPTAVYFGAEFLFEGAQLRRDGRVLYDLVAGRRAAPS